MITPAGEGVPLLYLTILMLVLSWIVLMARLAVRNWIKAFGLDDWLMCAGLILYSVTAALVIVCCFHGAGQLSEKLSAQDIMQGTKLFFIAEFFYASCTVPIKCSICVTLLRIADARRRFVWTLWAIMAIVAIASVIFIVSIANICHPINMLWGETTEGTCNTSLNSSVSFFFSAISIVTDWSLAILPGVLLWNIQMKGRVKLSVALMLGLAAFASCATIVRLRYLTLYDDQSEFMFSTGSIGLWSILEEGIGIIAGSMAALRPLLNLPIFGSSKGGSSLPPPSTNAFRSTPSQLRGTRGEQLADEVKMENFDTPNAKGTSYGAHGTQWSDDDDRESQNHILKETQVSVTAEHGQPQSAADDWARQRVLGWHTSS